MLYYLSFLLVDYFHFLLFFVSNLCIPRSSCSTSCFCPACACSGYLLPDFSRLHFLMLSRLSFLLVYSLYFLSLSHLYAPPPFCTYFLFYSSVWYLRITTSSFSCFHTLPLPSVWFNPHLFLFFLLQAVYVLHASVYFLLRWFIIPVTSSYFLFLFSCCIYVFMPLFSFLPLIPPSRHLLSPFHFSLILSHLCCLLPPISTLILSSSVPSFPDDWLSFCWGRILGAVIAAVWIL